jgi:hypothetical protein
LLTESEILKDEVLSGTEGTDNPSQEMSERHDYGQNHGQNLIETRRIKLVSKSFILRVHEVLTRDKPYIVCNTDLTRQANGLNRVSQREFPAETAVEAADPANNQYASEHPAVGLARTPGHAASDSGNSHVLRLPRHRH